MHLPLVSIVCLCHNQAKFVKESIHSVLDQTYPNIQLIVVDDASTDESPAIIQKLVEEHPAIKFIPLQHNVGNCKAFNIGFTFARGEFIIDLAADDVFVAQRIERQIRFFSDLDSSYGVIFTDATYIDEHGRVIRDHYEYLLRKRLLRNIPEGDVYRDVVARYFICSPTMMVRKEVIEKINGYDEELSYEDFDFWVRSSRSYKYAFLNEKLTKVRKVARSMSAGWYKQGDKQLFSTYLVCKKITHLNRSEEDTLALTQRLKYELRQSVFSENRKEAELFYGLLNEIGRSTAIDHLLHYLNKVRLPLVHLRKWYHQWRYST